MNAGGRKLKRPPPRVAKSSGTGCSPNKVVSARSRLAIAKGVATVHATSRRMSDQRQSADLSGMIESKCERNRAAERMPDDHRTLQPERLTKVADDARLRGERHQRLVRPQRIAAAGPIENDDAEIARKATEQRMREVQDWPASP